MGKWLVSDADLNAVIQRLRRVEQSHVLSMAEMTGSILLEAFYHGSMERYYDDKTGTLSEVARRLGVHRSTLSASIRLTQHRVLFGNDLFESLSLGHHKVLLGVEDEQQRLDLARTCRLEGWSVERLSHQYGIRTSSVARSSRKGRPRKHVMEKLINKLTTAHSHVDAHEVELSSLSEEKARTLLSQLQQLQTRQRLLIELLETRVETLDGSTMLPTDRGMES